MTPKLQRNKDATIHFITKQDTILLQGIYNKLLDEIENIIKRDELPEADWFPSEDFDCLVRQKVE